MSWFHRRPIEVTINDPIRVSVHGSHGEILSALASLEFRLEQRIAALAKLIEAHGGGGQAAVDALAAKLRTQNDDLLTAVEANTGTDNP